MTLNDFLKRININEDKDKMLIYNDGVGWSNLVVEIGEYDIKLSPDKNHSPFSSDK